MYLVVDTLKINYVSSLFVLLSILLILCCISYNSIYFVNGYKYFVSLLLCLQFCLINVFLSPNLLIFFIYFESVLLPMLVIVGIWGSRQRKIHALYYLFFFTLVGSVFMLAGIIYIYNSLGSLEYIYILYHNFTFKEEIVLFTLFFFGFILVRSLGNKYKTKSWHSWQSPVKGVVFVSVGDVYPSQQFIFLNLIVIVGFGVAIMLLELEYEGRLHCAIPLYFIWPLVLSQLTSFYSLLNFSVIYHTYSVSGWVIAIFWIAITLAICCRLKNIYIVAFLMCNVIFFSCIEGVNALMKALPIGELIACDGKIYLWNEVYLQWWLPNTTVEDKLRITQVMRHLFYHHCGDIPDYGPAIDKWVQSHVISPKGGIWYTVSQLEELAVQQTQPFDEWLREYERKFIFSWGDFLNPSWLFVKFFKYYLKIRWPSR